MKSKMRKFFIVWLIMLAGFPVYYLMPERDWNYQYWGAPQEIVKSRMFLENPAHPGERGYSRVFIIRPSAENCMRFGEGTRGTTNRFSMEELLRYYDLPGPYRYGWWIGHGDMDYVECGNGLVLVRDYSRNKGGLFSSRMEPETVRKYYPLHFFVIYAWAWFSALILLLTPFLIVFGVFWGRLISAFGYRQSPQ